MELVCVRYMDGYTEYTQLTNLEAVAHARGYDPRVLLKHLSLALNTGVVHEQKRWLVKGMRTQATLQSLLDTYEPTCIDCSRAATHGLARPTHCKVHKGDTMTNKVKHIGDTSK
jgi:translation initiation factor 2 beta subunit (eIF-2beta)/eIF-5